MSDRSPYVVNANRLAEVISAIQVMAVYRYHMRNFSAWAESICGDKNQGEYWKKIFEEHPEFFRLDTTRTMASLVWRRQFPKRFHVDRDKILTNEEYVSLLPEEYVFLSRAPLSPADIKTLIDAAINLHSRAVELQREDRWWLTLVSSAAGGLVGAAITAVVAFTLHTNSH